MCRMVAFSSAEPLDAAPWLAHLSRFSLTGNFVDRWEKRPGGNHPDGWGIAFRNGEEMRVVRSGKPANSDPLLKSLATRTDRFIGHVRFASNPATVHAGNSHPFLTMGVVLAHNGTFRGRIGAEGDERQVSDTLVFLEQLADRWQDRTAHSLAGILREMLSDRELVGEYSAANLLIGTAGSLFALRNYRKDEGYYTLFLRAGPGEVVVSSEPLDGGTGWRPLRNGEMVEISLPEPRSVLLDVPS